MKELRDLSRLPVNPEYWERLEAKILAELGPRVRESAEARRNWWTPLAARAVPLGGLALAASVAALMLVPREVPEPLSTKLLRAPEHDSTLVAFVSAPAPPSIASLVLPSTRSPR